MSTPENMAPNASKPDEKPSELHEIAREVPWSENQRLATPIGSKLNLEMTKSVLQPKDVYPGTLNKALADLGTYVYGY